MFDELYVNMTPVVRDLFSTENSSFLLRQDSTPILCIASK